MYRFGWEINSNHIQDQKDNINVKVMVKLTICHKNREIPLKIVKTFETQPCYIILENNNITYTISSSPMH